MRSWGLWAVLAIGCGHPHDGAAPTAHRCDVPTPEDCFNGVDDDCNGLADCDDPSCLALTECVPAAAAAFSLGVEMAPDDPCPTHYAAGTLLGQEPGADADCAGCRCDSSLICRTTVHALAPHSCGGAPTADVAVDSTSCNGGPSGIGLRLTTDSLRIDAITAEPSCAPSGTPAPAPISWHERTRFCATAQVGGGCPDGFVCVARNSAKHCALTDGEASCSGRYRAESGGAWYAGTHDTRDCGSACTCGAPTGASCGDSVVGLASFYSGGCQYTPLMLPPGDSCSLPTMGPFESATVVLRDEVPPRCAVGNAVSGSLAPSDRRTLCCWDGGPP